MIQRDMARRLLAAARKFPALTLTGPRQSGKSTLARALFPKHAYVSLEAPDVRAFATSDPRAFLAQFPKGAVLDEVQRCPQLPSYLQGMIDDKPARGRWILTGSQNLALLQSVSQSLAGRTALLRLLPLTRNEVRRFKKHPKSLDESMLAGGCPRIFDHRLTPAEWLAAYVGTYLERDVRTLSSIGDLATFQRFIQLCASRTGQLLNLSSLGSDCGISQPTAKAWLSILEATFIVMRLPPYFANLGKRLVRTPKLHFYDTGLVCWLLGIRDVDQLRVHPLRGAIFETWVVSEIVKHRANRGESASMFFFRDQQGLEADLVIERGGSLVVLEAKAAQTATPQLIAAPDPVVELLARSRKTRSVVVYGGLESQVRTHSTLLAWNDLDRSTW